MHLDRASRTTQLYPCFFQHHRSRETVKLEKKKVFMLSPGVIKYPVNYGNRYTHDTPTRCPLLNAIHYTTVPARSKKQKLIRRLRLMRFCVDEARKRTLSHSFSSNCVWPRSQAFLYLFLTFLQNLGEEYFLLNSSFSYGWHGGADIASQSNKQTTLSRSPSAARPITIRATLFFCHKGV